MRMKAVMGHDCWKCLFFHECEIRKAFDKYSDCITYEEGDCKSFLMDLLAVANITVPSELVDLIDPMETKITCNKFQPVPYYYGSPVLSREKWRELGVLRDIE